MAAIQRWTQTWDGSALAWSETWGEGGAFLIDAQGPIALTGTLGLSGELDQRIPWEPMAPLELTLGGTLGLSGDIVIATAATFQVDALGAIALAGQLALAGDIQIAGPVPFDIDAVAPITLAGALALTGDIVVTRATTFVVDPQAPIAMAGTLATSGDIVVQQPVVFSVEQVGTAALVGQLGLSGDLVYATPVPFDIEATAAIALAGALGLSGDLQWRVPFVIEAVAPIAMGGTLGLTGALQYGTPLELVALAPIALAGQLGISGEIALSIPTTVPDVVGLTQAEALAAIEAARMVPVIVEEFSADVAVGTVISQAPAGGSPALVGQSVTITVSSGSIANDPKLIARRRKLPNIGFKGLAKPKKKREEPAPAAPPTPKPSGLLLGLMARGLMSQPEPAAPQPVPVLLDASMPLGVPTVPIAPAAAETVPEVVPPPAPDLAARVDALEHQLQLVRAELEALRRPPEPIQATARDPVHEALHAVLPTIGEPIDLDAVPEPAPEPPAPPAAPAPSMTPEEIEAENQRRIALALQRML